MERRTMKAPNTKLQAPEKLQTAMLQEQDCVSDVWGFGASMELGAWCLELFVTPPPRCRQNAATPKSRRAVEENRCCCDPAGVAGPPEWCARSGPAVAS